MDNKGNSKYNPLTGKFIHYAGESRIGIEKLVPEHLNGRFEHKLEEHYDAYKLKIPSSSDSSASRKKN